MRVIVDLTRGVPALDLLEPDDFGRFHVEVRGDADPDRLAQAVVVERLGLMDGPDVLVSLEAVRRLAGPVQSPEWEAGLGEMVRLAERHGWTTEDCSAVRAHIERADA